MRQLSRIPIYHYLFLTLIYLLVSAFSYAKYGVALSDDSYKYLTYADSLKDGFHIQQHYILYIGYVLFIFFIRLLTFSTAHATIIIAQYLLSWGSLMLLYRAIARWTGSLMTGLLVALLCLGYVDLNGWNSHLLCESFYTSMVILSLCVLSGYLTKGKRPLAYGLLTACVVLLTMFTKPTGIALFGGLVVVLLGRVWQKTGTPVRIGLLAGGAAGLVFVANKMLSTFILVEQYQQGEIVYLAHLMGYNADNSLLYVKVPDDLVIPPEEYEPLTRVLLFIYHNFTFWFTLFIRKLYFFLSHTRPYYSTFHNLFALAYLVPSYGLAIGALTNSRLGISVRLFGVAYLLIHTLSVTLTSVDWGGRFLIPVLPVVFILAGWQLMFLYNKYRGGHSFA
ncbi:hypothetical protein AB9P05_17165 [Roseivirga sp. BDSF3-8]|uniref:hypothetical protein n=1 Tax=Roseivirga sp. BDSF3-8 TaxID=3241598 RepID=UPI003532307C